MTATLFIQYLLLISFLNTFTGIFSSKIITFRAQKVISRPLDSQTINLNAFERWFKNQETPLTILSLNPGLVKVEKVSESEFKGYLKPIQFPGALVKSIVGFNVISSDTSVSVVCKEGSVQQEIEAPAFVKKMMLSLLPDITSSTTFCFDAEQATLSNNAQLQIKSTIPSWFPINKEAAERGGSEAVQKSMDADMNGLLDRILDRFIFETTTSTVGTASIAEAAVPLN